MTFEEDYPGIYNQGWETLGQVIPFGKWMDKDFKKMIQKHCKDNQKIREAIEKHLVCGHDAVGDHQPNTCRRCLLIKELDL